MRTLTLLKPSYASEHRRMLPVLAAARRLDIATNPSPEALFEVGSAGFQIWCTPTEHPEGWEAVAATMFPGAFAKACEFVASVHWHWDDEAIVGLNLATAAYALADRLPEQYTASETRRDLAGKVSIFNRPAELVWARQHLHRLFRLAGVPQPPVFTNSE
jgi:hypothetical protein